MKSLGLFENEVLLSKVEVFQGKVLDAIKEYEVHPSILKIKENVAIDGELTVSKSLKALNTRKAFPLMTIPPKVLKDSITVIEKFIQDIWNEEILMKKNSQVN